MPGKKLWMVSAVFVYLKANLYVRNSAIFSWLGLPAFIIIYK